MVARQAMDRHAKRRQRFAKMRIRPGAVVLDKVAGNNSDIGLPAAITVMRENGLQGIVGDGAAQRALRVRKKVRIRQVQNTQQA